MKNSDKIYAVLTGDLIKSSRLSSTKSKNAMERLKKRVEEFGDLYPDSIVGRMDTFRHDSWQLLLERPSLAVRAAIFLRASLKMDADANTKYDTRISIGTGPVELISKRRISDSRGMAFTLSGKGLDEMDSRYFVFIADEKHRAFWPALQEGVIPLLDCVAGDWTPTESRAVYGALKGWTQEESAQHWPPDKKTGKQPTRQAIGDSLIRAHWGTIDMVLLWVEKEIEQALKLA
ncbi:MAG: hypothetical protein KJ874_01920 [Acidobacteria bacterium]|nr:hypothetical protein [Acidobacteriota bacterium]